jgi:hypothetical protein
MDRWIDGSFGYQSECRIDQLQCAVSMDGCLCTVTAGNGCVGMCRVCDSTH